MTTAVTLELECDNHALYPEYRRCVSVSGTVIY